MSATAITEIDGVSLKGRGDKPSLAPLLAASIAKEQRKKGKTTMTAVPGFSHAELLEEQARDRASRAMVVAHEGGAAIAIAKPVVMTFSEDQIRTIRQTVAKDCTDMEFAFFLEVARRSQLDPFRKQIYAVKRGGKVAIQTGIDGFRLIASRTGLYEGQEPAQWCGPDGVWVDVWLKEEPPAAARVGVLRKGFKEPLRAVARFSSYAQDNLWQRMPEVMIAKVAEALALRKAFPEDLSGLYSDDEMAQADKEHPPNVPADAPSELDALEARAVEQIGCANTLDELKTVWTGINEQIKGARMGAKQIRRLREAKDARKARLETEAKGDADMAKMGDSSEAWGMTPPGCHAFGKG